MRTTTSEANGGHLEGFNKQNTWHRLPFRTKGLRMDILQKCLHLTFRLKGYLKTGYSRWLFIFSTAN